MQIQQDTEIVLDLYDTIAFGQSRRELILPNCLLLIGLTRVGKSTLFNWINGKPLIGRRNEQSSILNYYLLNEDESAAEVSDGNTSKTLIPNVHNVGNITRIDTAGFKDQRNHLQVFSANCMLNFIFEKGQCYSFLLVICRDQLGGTARELLDTLYHFINLFQYDQLDKQIKMKLLHSVSLVITKTGGSAEDGGVIQMIKSIIKNCRKANYRYEKKQSCLELLQDIIQNQRIQFFRMARESENAPKCEILQTLRIRGWGSFDLVEAKTKYPNLLVNSFGKQYQDLEEGDKKSYFTLVQDKVRGYITVATIFKEVVDIIIEGITSTVIDYRPIFSKMAEYNLQFDKYSGINKDLKFRAKFNGMTIRRQSKDSQRNDAGKTMVKIQAVMKLVGIIDQIIPQTIPNSSKLMDILKQIYMRIFLILQELCCHNAEEQCMLINFAFIVLRGFEDFKVISQVDTLNIQVNGSPRKIYDNLGSISNRKIEDYKLIIVKNISSLNRQQKLVAFPKAKELYEYVLFVREFMSGCKDIDETVIQNLRFKNIADRLLCCQLMLNQGDRYRDVLIGSMSIFTELVEKRGKVVPVQCKKELKAKISMQADVIVLENFFLSCVRILGRVLVKKQQFTLAIEVFSTIEQSAMVCECYEFQLKKYYTSIQGHDKAVECEQLQQIYTKYAEYCKYHGRIDKGVLLLQEYHKLVTDCINLRKWKRKVVLFLRDRERTEAVYTEECEEGCWFVDLDQGSLLQLVQAIKRVVDVDTSPVVSLNHTMVL